MLKVVELKDCIKIIVTHVLPDFLGKVSAKLLKESLERNVNIFSEHSFMSSALSNKDTPRVELTEEKSLFGLKPTDPVTLTP